MATREKREARALMRERGIKYTEALRAVRERHAKEVKKVTLVCGRCGATSTSKAKGGFIPLKPLEGWVIRPTGVGTPTPDAGEPNVLCPECAR